MANEFEKVAEDIGEGIKTAAVDTVHEVEKIVGIVDKTDKVLHTVIDDSSKLKQPAITVAKAAVALQTQFAAVIAEKGLDWTQDTDLIAAVKAFIETDVEAIFIPAIEEVYGDIEADLSPATPAAAPTPAEPAPDAPAGS